MAFGQGYQKIIIEKAMPKKPNQKLSIGILGNGEVGQAIARFYKNPKIKDLTRDDGLEGVDVLHVCIPWSFHFEKTVASEIKRIKPKLTIIHSTIAPETTKKLAAKFSGTVAHSPIRGTHPDLYKGIKTFVKYIGADDPKVGLMAKKHLESVGIKTKVFPSSVATEIGKILDTTYYGLVIAWHGEMKKMTDKMGVDFDHAVTHFNETYNEGYKKLGRHNVVRPVLSAPKEYIGGHCILPNAKLLKKYMGSKAIDLILDYERKVQES
jgi:UDP-N-acetyl-D-mannosaminuronate dehydrogenase